jgi:hypothetical protein
MSLVSRSTTRRLELFYRIYGFTVLQFYIFTVLRCYSFTVLRFCVFTVLRFYSFTVLYRVPVLLTARGEKYHMIHKNLQKFMYSLPTISPWYSGQSLSWAELSWQNVDYIPHSHCTVLQICGFAVLRFNVFAFLRFCGFTVLRLNSFTVLYRL